MGWLIAFLASGYIIGKFDLEAKVASIIWKALTAIYNLIKGFIKKD